LSKNNTLKSKNQFKWTNPYDPTPVDPNKKITLETQTRLYGKPFNDKDTTASNHSKNAQNLRSDLLKNRFEVDVMYTLHMHHDDYEYDLDMERKMEKGILARRAQMEDKKKKKRLDKIKRRVKAKQKREREQYASTLNQPPSGADARTANSNATQDPNRYMRLVTGTIEDHRMKFPDNDDFIYPENLYNFWKSIPL
jgi:hypothetical protein